jgi:hypothetical protein
MGGRVLDERVGEDQHRRIDQLLGIAGRVGDETPSLSVKRWSSAAAGTASPAATVMTAQS